MPLLSVHLRAPLSIQGGKSWGRAVFLPPNFIPRNSDLPRLKAASDWLMARSACLICIKQLYGDGSDLLKGTGAHIRDMVFFHCQAGYGDNDQPRLYNHTLEAHYCYWSTFYCLFNSTCNHLLAFYSIPVQFLDSQRLQKRLNINFLCLYEICSVLK